jgi:hypothetical protein
MREYVCVDCVRGTSYCLLTRSTSTNLQLHALVHEWLQQVNVICTHEVEPLCSQLKRQQQHSAVRAVDERAEGRGRACSYASVARARATASHTHKVLLVHALGVPYSIEVLCVCTYMRTCVCLCVFV